MMAVTDERTARTMLGWLCEPGDRGLHQMLAVEGPVETVAMLRNGTGDTWTWRP